MQASSSPPHGAAAARQRRLSLPGLVAIIFYSVCGGPFGTEDVISAAGPLLALVGFAVMPFVWSMPEALITAELATTFPDNSGYVAWVTAAFGPFWGFQEGFLSWVSAVCDNAVYPVLFCDYLKHVWPAAGGGLVRRLCIVIFSLVLSALNYAGLHIVGWAAFGLTLFTLLPFAYIVPVGLTQVQIGNLFIRPPLADIDWRTYLNVLFWNLNYWDTVSTLAGEVENPSKTFPTALFIAGILVFSAYLLPTLVGVGMPGKAGGAGWKHWHGGSQALVGEHFGGLFVKAWVVCAAGVSNVGMFLSVQAANAYQLQGMAELGWLPACFAQRSRCGTPTAGLLAGLALGFSLSSFKFLAIVDLVSSVYCMAQLLEFSAFVWLRHKHPDLHRPYRVPLRSTSACIGLLASAMALAVLILALPVVVGDWPQVACLVAVPVLGILSHCFLDVCRRRGWVHFLRAPPGNIDEVLASQVEGIEGSQLLPAKDTTLSPVL